MYYTYIYLDPRKPGKYSYDGLNMSFLYEPFYIGKGVRNRMQSHLYPHALKTKNRKTNKIKSILNNNIKPYYFKYNQSVIQEDALLCEIQLIKAIGRLDIGTGTLTNMTDGGDGTTNLIIEKTRKPVDKIDINSHRIIESYKSMKEAAKINNIEVSNISSCCLLKSISAGGYYWKFGNCQLNLPKNRQETAVDMLDENYNIIKTYARIKDALKENNLSSTKMHNCCNGQTGTRDGIIWEYAHISDELRMQYRAKREAINSNTEKPIRRVCKLTGEDTIYKSMNEAAADNNITPSMVNMIAKGKRGKLLSYNLFYIGDEKYNDIIKVNNNTPYAHCKPIIQLDLLGNVIKEWVSATHASKELGISHSRICMVARGEANKAGGFKWIYNI